MQKKRLFTRLVLLASIVCLAAFAWADGSNVNIQQNTTTDVYNSTDLRTAAANQGSGDIIVHGSIDMGALSLSIPAGRTVTLTLSEGSSLDFSSVTDYVEIDTKDYYVGINNLGNITLTGNGDLVMSKASGSVALIYCLNDSSLDITSGEFSVTLGGASTGYRHLIYNYGNVTIENSMLSADGGGYFWALCNDGDAHVEVTDSTFSINGGNAYDIRAIKSSSESNDVTIIHSTIMAMANGDTVLAIDNKGGTVTVSGDSKITATGDNDCGAIENDYGCTVTVSDSTITASGDETYAIYNECGSVKVANVTSSADAVGTACVIYNIGLEEQGIYYGSIDVIGGTFTANGDTAYAITNVESGIVTVWSGNFTGKLNAAGTLIRALHGGTYLSCDSTFDAEVMVADDATAEQISDDGWKVFTKATLSPDNSYCFVEKGKQVTVPFNLLSGDTPLNVTSAEISVDLPAGLTASVGGVTGSGSTFTVTISNTGCDTTGGYLATVTAYGDSKYKASTLLNIVVAQQGGTAAEVKGALESETVAAVSVSGDVEITDNITIVGNKILIVDAGNSLNMNGKALIVDSGKSLKMIGAGTTSTDEGPIFSVNGTLNIAEGKFCAASGDYITNSESADITIADGVQFYFGTDETAVKRFVKNYLASSNKTLTQVEGGYWKVTTNATSSSSSSGGCNAGFAALALAGLAFVPFKKRK